MTVCFSSSRKKQSSKKVTDLSDPSTETMFMQLQAKLALEAFQVVCFKASIFSNDLGDVARWGGGPKQIAAKQAHGGTQTNMRTHTPTQAMSVMPFARCAVNSALTGNKSFFSLGIRRLSGASLKTTDTSSVGGSDPG